MNPPELVATVTERLRPLDHEVALVWWESSTAASPEAEARRTEAELAQRRALADADTYVALTAAAARTSARADAADPLLARQVDALHRAARTQQIPDDLRQALVERETAVESRYTSFRAELHGGPVDDNTILQILRTSTDSAEREAAWRASKQIGAEVADDVRELARLRNQAARHLGARDHFALALQNGELDETRLFETLDEVDAATAEPFRTWKADLDTRLAARFGIAPADLAPWHVDDPFFQSAPADGAVDLDPYFADADLTALTVRTFDGTGLDIRPLLDRSDLLPRDGKSQHAFCIDLDRAGDVRVLCNVRPNERWMDTMLHEFGHAVYDRGIDPTLPWLLHEPAHALTTEAVAMLCGRLVHDPEWLVTVAGVNRAEVDALRGPLAAARRAARLTFARWVLVVTNFERALYADPDGDLDSLWWDLVERYQLVRRPADRSGTGARPTPDWAAKIHLAVVPVYYQNYLYGELLASQLAATLTARVGGLVDRPAAGRYLTEAVFHPGSRDRWDRLVADATGEPLNARFLAAELAADAAEARVA